jgi:hypothetical protein
MIARALQLPRLNSFLSRGSSCDAQLRRSEHTRNTDEIEGSQAPQLTRRNSSSRGKRVATPIPKNPRGLSHACRWNRQEAPSGTRC